MPVLKTLDIGQTGRFWRTGSVDVSKRSVEIKRQTIIKRATSMSIAWPDWWKWELELTPHLEERMTDRGFNEVDLRSMLEKAKGYRQNVVAGRWVIDARHRRRRWEVIVEPDPVAQLLVVAVFRLLERKWASVEPDPVAQLLVVVTAYPVYGG